MRFLGLLLITFFLISCEKNISFDLHEAADLLVVDASIENGLPPPFSKDTNKVIVLTRITDPPGLGNSVRYYTKKNSGPFLPGEGSVYDDQFMDGTTYELADEIAKYLNT